MPFCDRNDNQALVHCRLRPVSPRHPVRYGLVWTRRNQYDASGALVCARRRNDVISRSGIDAPAYGPLRANMTSSTKKPEVDNVSQRRERRLAAFP